METTEIKRLLSAFYEGETSKSEEDQLYDYFKHEDVPEDLLSDKDLFLNLYKEEEIEIPKGLKQKLNSLIDGWEKEERTDETITNKTIHQIKWRWIIPIAASFLILFSIGITQFSSEIERKDTYSNPAIAYNELQKALLSVSGNLNKGIQQMENVQNEITRVDKILNKQFK